MFEQNNNIQSELHRSCFMADFINKTHRLDNTSPGDGTGGLTGCVSLTCSINSTSKSNTIDMI